MIERLETAGLGFYVKASKSKQKFGMTLQLIMMMLDFGVDDYIIILFH